MLTIASASCQDRHRMIFRRPALIGKLLTKSTYSTGTSALLIARLLQFANAFAVSILVIWRYGLDSAGSLALAAIPATLGAHLVCFGLPSALPRMSLSNGQRAMLGLISSTGFALLLLPVIALFAVLMAHSPAEAIAIGAIAFSGAWVGQATVTQILYILQGKNQFAPLVPGIHLIGTGLAALTSSFEGFALILMATRIGGCLVGFLPLAFERLRFNEGRRMLRSSVGYVPLDMMGLLAEQIPIMLMSGLLTRAELGILGLLRQFVTVADSVGWTHVLNNYPDLVRDPEKAAPRVAQRNEQLAWMAGAGTFVLASFAAIVVYKVPVLVPALILVLVPLPARYIASFCEQALRAAGKVRDCGILAVIRIVVGALLFWGFAQAWGFWGAVAASGLFSVFSGLLYRSRYLSLFPGHFRTIRPWRFA